ncbi:MAG TPA: 1-acyl-sn-glycerol-3-phosphate acyltransferase [Chthoniobacterales bacterium]|jgi:1-acyl-sn-glycerol-3-phosphate acyltransferase|nr:1-acyl-sn-glycerol-3-phosphate acyltransferase [Chthoniobacterales bacterium]
MRNTFHSIANRAAALFMKVLFGYSSRVHVVGLENTKHTDGFLLASNHISHFDPFIISAVVRRKIDWMAMAEFFPLPIVGLFLRAVDAFPAERDRADRKTIRTAIERLKDGRMVGVFPEGGIRDGTQSLLEGAPLRAGASTLAHIAQVPVLPCVILGSDRLYAKRNWLPFRRTRIWIGFGNAISNFPELEKSRARERIEEELTAAFQKIYGELQERFRLTQDDLPHPPRERMKKPTPELHHEGHEAHQGGSNQNNTLPLRDLDVLRGGILQRTAAKTVDFAMCASMNLLQARHHLNGHSAETMEQYVVECEKLTLPEYYAAPSNVDLARAVANGTGATVTWRSPIQTKFPPNNSARAEFFPSDHPKTAPTVIMLHALMSAANIGYRRWASRFNELGWNACFVHLPYHYSRVPRGYWNGELAITADLVRNAEGLRQGVMEVRQLIAALREHGCREFGILGTSYGAWIGALLASVERDFRFLALMAPIVNVEHAIWQNPATVMMRRELHRAKITPELVARHFHLSSPSHTEPLCDPARVLFVLGEFDLVAPAADIEAIHQKWRGSELLRVPQGHFGYRMMRETVARLKERGL